MKPSVCTVDFLSAAGTDIPPVCAVSQGEIQLEPTLGLEELFWSTNFIDASVPLGGSVAHADARPVDPSPADVAVGDLSTSELELCGGEWVPVRVVCPVPALVTPEHVKLIWVLSHSFLVAAAARDRVVQKILLPAGATALCVLLRPGSGGSKKKIPRNECKKFKWKCGMHEWAGTMKAVFEWLRALENPATLAAVSLEWGLTG